MLPLAAAMMLTLLALCWFCFPANRLNYQSSDKVYMDDHRPGQYQEAQQHQRQPPQRLIHLQRGQEQAMMLTLLALCWFCFPANRLNYQSSDKAPSWQPKLAAASGSIWPMNPGKERPERPHSKIFCGLPIGVSSFPGFIGQMLPLAAAMMLTLLALCWFCFPANRLNPRQLQTSFGCHDGALSLLW
jgi:hypothetical protein